MLQVAGHLFFSFLFPPKGCTHVLSSHISATYSGHLIFLHLFTLITATEDLILWRPSSNNFSIVVLLVPEHSAIEHPRLIYIYTISQQKHCSDGLLISSSCYMFRRMYVIIRMQDAKKKAPWLWRTYVETCRSCRILINYRHSAFVGLLYI
jgi:hypothetical protein